MASEVNSTKHIYVCVCVCVCVYKRIKTYFFKLFQNMKRRNASTLILWGQHQPSMKAKDSTQNHKKLLASISHSSTLTWKIPWKEEPGRLQSMGSLRVGNDWVTSLSLFTFMHWRKKWQPTPVFLLGESQGQGSLVGCRLWGRTESDTTEAT